MSIYKEKMKAFRTVQRVITKAPLWRSFADVENLIRALESKGRMLFPKIRVSPTGKFLLASMFREKKDDVDISEIEEDIVFQEEKKVSRSQKDEIESNDEDENSDNENGKKHEDEVKEEEMVETQPLKLWCDYTFVVSEGIHSMTLGIYEEDWNDVVVNQKHLMSYSSTNNPNHYQSDDEDIDMTMTDDDLVILDNVDRVRCYVEALVGLAPFLRRLASSNGKLDSSSSSAEPIQKLRSIVLHNLSAGDRLRNVFDRGALDEARDATLLRPLLKTAKLITLKGPRLLLAEGQLAGACFVLLSGCVVIKKRERLRGLGVDVDTIITRADCNEKVSYAGVVIGGDLLAAELGDMKKENVKYTNTVQIPENCEAELLVFSDAAVRIAVEARHDGSVGKFLSRATRIASKSGLSELSSETVSSLALVLRRREVEQGEVLTVQGEPADSMFILCRGEVKIVIRAEPDHFPPNNSAMHSTTPLSTVRMNTVGGSTNSTTMISSTSTGGGGGSLACTNSMTTAATFLNTRTPSATHSDFKPSKGAAAVASANIAHGKNTPADHMNVLAADRVSLVQRFSLIGKEAVQRLPCRDKVLEEEDIVPHGFDLKKLKDVAMAVSFASALKLRARASLTASARAQTTSSTADDPSTKPLYGCSATALGPCLVLEVSRRRMLQLPASVQRNLMAHLLKTPLRPVDVLESKDEICHLSAKLEMLKHQEKEEIEAELSSNETPREKTLLEISKEKAMINNNLLPRFREHGVAAFGSASSRDWQHPNKPLELPPAPGSMTLEIKEQQMKIKLKQQQLLQYKAHQGDDNEEERSGSNITGSLPNGGGLQGHRTDSMFSQTGNSLINASSEVVSSSSLPRGSRFMLAHIAVTSAPSEDASNSNGRGGNNGGGGGVSGGGGGGGNGLIKRTKPLPSCYYRIIAACASQSNAIEEVSNILEKSNGGGGRKLMEGFNWRIIPKTSTHLLPPPFLTPGIFDHFVLYDLYDKGRVYAVLQLPFFNKDMSIDKKGHIDDKHHNEDYGISLMHDPKCSRLNPSSATMFQSLGVKAGGLGDSQTFMVRIGFLFDRTLMKKELSDQIDLNDIIDLIGPVGIIPTQMNLNHHQNKNHKNKKINKPWTGRYMDNVSFGLWHVCDKDEKAANMGTSLLSIRLKSKLKKLRQNKEELSFDELFRNNNKNHHHFHQNSNQNQNQNSNQQYDSHGNLKDNTKLENSVEKGWAFVSKQMAQERQSVLDLHHSTNSQNRPSSSSSSPVKKEVKSNHKLGLGFSKDKKKKHSNHKISSTPKVIENTKKGNEEAERHIILLDQLRDVKHPIPKEHGRSGVSKVGNTATSGHHAFRQTIGGHKSHRSRKDRFKPPLI